MKCKIIIFSLVFILGVSLVCAFESPVYHIGVDIPAEESEEIIVDVDDTPIAPSGGSSNSPSGGGNIPEDDDIILTEGDNSDFDNSFEEDNEIELLGSTDSSPNVLSRITGAVTEALGTGGTISVSVLILGIVGAFAFVKIRKIRAK